jgi:hypothetical protein
MYTYSWIEELHLIFCWPNQRLKFLLKIRNTLINRYGGGSCFSWHMAVRNFKRSSRPFSIYISIGTKLSGPDNEPLGLNFVEEKEDRVFIYMKTDLYVISLCSTRIPLLIVQHTHDSSKYCMQWSLLALFLFLKWGVSFHIPLRPIGLNPMFTLVSFINPLILAASSVKSIEHKRCSSRCEKSMFGRQVVGWWKTLCVQFYPE